MLMATEKIAEKKQTLQASPAHQRQPRQFSVTHGKAISLMSLDTAHRSGSDSDKRKPFIDREHTRELPYRYQTALC